MTDKDRISTWEILVVDDEPDSLEVVTRVLSYWGATVHTAANGAEALAVVQSISPTFILMDLSMPRMDGWETLHHLKDNLRTAQIPIIALTAHAMRGDRERALRAGFHYYLTKPLSPVTLVSDLLKLFSEHPMPAAGSADGARSRSEEAAARKDEPQ